jgi:hypothetical protein
MTSYRKRFWQIMLLHSSDWNRLVGSHFFVLSSHSHLPWQYNMVWQRLHILLALISCLKILSIYSNLYAQMWLCCTIHTEAILRYDLSYACRLPLTICSRRFTIVWTPRLNGIVRTKWIWYWILFDESMRKWTARLWYLFLKN